MNSTERKREALYKAYQGRKWQHKVKKMTPAQVVAVFYNLHAQGKV